MGFAFVVLLHNFFACVDRMSSVLDPRIGYSGLSDDCADDEIARTHLLLAKSSLEERYRKHYLPSALSATPTSSSTLSRQSSSISVTSSSSASPQKNFTSRYKRDRSMVDELDMFWKLPQEDFDSCDPLAWWAGRRSQFPNLSRYARDILAVPGKRY